MSAHTSHPIRLIINADDYGMCPAVTDGILACFAQGVITRASIMPPAPDAVRAARLAREQGLPLGVHLTLACEWEGLRWHALTGAPSLGGRDQPLPPHVRDLDHVARPDEVRAELLAQIRWLHDQGVTPQHIDSHIVPFDQALLAEVSLATALPSRDMVAGSGGVLPLDSIWHLSIRPYHSKLADLLAHVRGLGPGTHMIVCHPALDRPELLRLVAPESPRWKWARDIRVTDLQALLDSRFLRACRDREIILDGGLSSHPVTGASHAHRHDFFAP